MVWIELLCSISWLQNSWFSKIDLFDKKKMYQWVLICDYSKFEMRSFIL